MFRLNASRMVLVIIGISLADLGCSMNDDVMRWENLNPKNWAQRSDPMTVLRTSTDGDERAKAMYALKEPKKNGDSDAIQEEAIQILTDAAVNDPRALCRMAGLSALGRFEDPRAVKAILAGYYGSSAFPTDQANSIRVAAMTALGHKRSSESLALLARAAAAPTAASAKPDVQLASQKEEDPIDKILAQTDPDVQATRDARLAAVRAMGMSKDPNAVPVLIPLLAESDVALRDRAHEALQNITGHKDVAPTAEAWSQRLNMQAAPKS